MKLFKIKHYLINIFLFFKIDKIVQHLKILLTEVELKRVEGASGNKINMLVRV